MKKIAISNNSNNELVQNLIGRMLKNNIEACLFNELSDIVGQTFDFIILYDYNKPLPSEFKSSTVINIHPSLLPAFEGENAIANAFLSGVKVSGITINDTTGRIIAQYPVMISNLMHLDEFEEKIHSTELKFVPVVIEKLLENKAFDYNDLFKTEPNQPKCGGCGHCGGNCNH